MKKKLVSLFLTIAMAATLLAGCGNDSQTGSNGQTQGSQEENKDGEDANAGAANKADGEDKEDASDANGGEDAGSDGAAGSMEGKKVGFTVPSVGNDFMLAVTEAVKAALEAQGATCQVDAADGDVTKQIEQIENYATMGMDLIVVFPINGEALTSVGQKVMNEGIPVFAFAMEIPDGATTQMLSAEEGDMGAACVEMTNAWIDKTFPDAGDGEVKVYLLASSYSPEAVERCDAMRAIKDNPKVTVIEEETEDWNSVDAARTRIENAFLTNPDINLVMAANGTSALGVESYMASSDCPIDDLSKFGIFTVDETEEIVAKIKASANDESVLRGTVSMGSIEDTVNDFMSAASPILTGQEPIPVWNGGCKSITADTLAE